jgi:hypothetical protein
MPSVLRNHQNKHSNLPVLPMISEANITESEEDELIYGIQKHKKKIQN